MCQFSSQSLLCLYFSGDQKGTRCTSIGCGGQPERESERERKREREGGKRVDEGGREGRRVRESVWMYERRERERESQRERGRVRESERCREGV